jgi:hypothetical protein
MEKHFYKKIYIITLWNFWNRSYSWPNTQHIQNLATEDLYFSRYCRSRFFTFVFFMQKLTGISSGKNNNSCGIFHHQSNKSCFTFFCFFCYFLCNLQETAKSQVLFKNHFAVRPLRLLDSYTGALILRLTPWKETSPRNVTPRGRWPARVGKIRRGSPESWPGKGVRRG